MDARSAYLKRRHTPTPFSQGPEMKNYSRMMELQSQAPNFTKNDPRFNELKDARRKYNREDNYKIGERFNVAPLDVQKDFSDRTNVFRNEAPNVYRKMYPVSDLAMRYGDSGGLLGLAIKGLKGDIGKLGKDVASSVGITGAIDDTAEEQADYVGRTFGFYPTDVHPGLSSIEGPMEQSEVIYSPHGPTYYDRAEGLDFEDDPNQPYVAPDDYVEDDFGAFYTDENTLASERVLPFEDSGREAGIASLYGQGPQFGTTNRRYENEYRDFLASQSDTMRQFGPITYEEFADAYERMYQGKPQIGFR